MDHILRGQLRNALIICLKGIGMGSQCIGTDAMAGKFSPLLHNYLHRDNCFGLASLANLDQLPPKAPSSWRPHKIEQGIDPPFGHWR